MALIMRMLRWGFGLCAVLLVLLALLVSLARELMPLVSQYRLEVQQQVSQALGVPVKIGSLSGTWQTLSPQLSAHDVLLGVGDSATRLDQLDIRPNLLASLWARQLRIASVQLDGLHLIVREDQQGRWHVQGLPAAEGSAPQAWPELWQRLQSVSELSVFAGLLTLQPYGQEPLSFSYIEFTLRNGLLGQSADLRLRLPDGQSLAFNAQLKVDAQRWQNSQAKLYLDLPRSDWATWLPASLSSTWRLEQAQFSAQAWLDWRDGALTDARLILNDGQLRGAYADQPSVPIEHLSFSAALQQRQGAIQFQVDELSLQHSQGQWQPGQFSAQQELDAQGTTLAWQFNVQSLDLQPLQVLLAGYAPITPNVQQIIQTLALQGRLRNLQLRYQPQLEPLERLSYATNVQQVSSRAWGGVPALQNVSGTLSGTLAGGELHVDSQDFAIQFPRIFESMWHYQSAKARLLWRLDEQAFTLQSPYLRLRGDEGEVSGDLLIRLFKAVELEDYMDLRVGLSQGNAQHSKKYLPKPSAHFTPALANWLDQAIVKADIEQGWFQYQGALAATAGPGSRNVSLYFLVDNAELAFQPGWPALEQVRGEVLVGAEGVQVRVPSAYLSRTQLSSVQAHVAKVTEGQPPLLEVQAQLSSSLEDTLQILQNAPLGTAQVFNGWQGQGALDGALQLQIPLAGKARPKVIADFSSDNAQLNLGSPKLSFSELTGAFRFDSEAGLSSPAITAKAFGYPVQAQALAQGKPGHTSTRIEASSQMTVNTLAQWLGVTEKLPLNGNFAYQLSLLLEGEDSQLRVSSDLQGVAVELPAPFAKEAEERRPTTWRMTLQGNERRYWLDYGERVKLSLAAPFGDLAKGRGELRLGSQPVRLPTQSGLRLAGQLDELNWSAWQTALKPYIGASGVAGQMSWFAGAQLDIKRFVGFGVEVEDLVVGAQRAPQAWALSLSSDLLAGEVRLPDGRQPIVIDLSRLSFPAPEPAAEKESKRDKPDPLAALDPRSIPNLDLRIEKVMRGKELLGSWGFKARTQPSGVRFSELNLNLKGLLLTGDLTWQGPVGASTSHYEGRLQGENLARVLENWGFAPSVSSERFRLDADLSWLGSPARFALKRLNGRLEASLRDGQFVDVQGAASALRVFGLLNFNAIGRRLRLDFSDLLGQGFSYDSAKAHLTAKDGVLHTNKALRIEGPSSTIEIDGQLNAVTEEVNAKLLVTLPLTNNLPLAAVAVGAPLIGGALLVVDKLLGDKVARFASVQYEVKGPWANPDITFDKPFEKPQ